MSRMLEKEYLFRAPVERVWAALTTPSDMSRWMGMQVELEPRVGGMIKAGPLHPGVIQVFEPPHRLQWAWDPSDGTEPLVETITLYAEEGGTRLHLRSVAVGKWSANLMYWGANVSGWELWLEAMAGWVENGVAASDAPHGVLGAGFRAEEQDGVQRIFVRTVREGGPAARAGVQPGDTLKGWNGQPVPDTTTFWNLLRRSRPGERVRLELERGGAPVVAELVLGTP